jgi:predicted nucleic acid-binding protein
MPTIIFDTDFLSSFLKISRCDLVRPLYQVERAIIPIAVHRELAQTELLRLLLAIDWINVLQVEISPDERLLQESTFQTLGAGERACTLLAHSLPDAVLLMNDNKARQFARSLGITVVNIPAFLLACKMTGLVGSKEIIQIIEDLRIKDFYEFKSEIRDLLLKE